MIYISFVSDSYPDALQCGGWNRAQKAFPMERKGSTALQRGVEASTGFSSRRSVTPLMMVGLLPGEGA